MMKMTQKCNPLQITGLTQKHFKILKIPMTYDRQNRMTACFDKPFRDNYDRLLFTHMRQTI